MEYRNSKPLILIMKNGKMKDLECGITLFINKKKKKKKKKRMRLTSVFSISSRKSMPIILYHDYYSLI